MARNRPGSTAGRAGREAGHRRWLPSRALLAAITTSLLAPGAAAESVDPSLPQRFVTALPAGLAIGDRLTATGTNQTRLPLPNQPEVGWQMRLAAPILHAPLALAGERLLIAHGHGRISELDRRGRTLWSLRTGTELAGGPIVLGSGERLALTRSADVIRISSLGRELGRERLPLPEIDGPPVSSPTSDGGAVLGLGARLVRLGPRGSFNWTTPTPDPMRAVFEWRGNVVAVGRNGTVNLRPPVGDLREIANLATGIRAALLVEPRLWLLSVDHQLIELDLSVGKPVTRFSEPALDFTEFASGPAGSLRLLTRRGLLLALESDGREIARNALLPDAVAAEAAALIVDPRGAALAAFAGAALVAINPQVDTTSIAGTACPEPLRPTPLGTGLVVAACRSGLLRALSDRAR
jgi:hypothetical protein